jgi:hypothetical protein
MKFLNKRDDNRALHGEDSEISASCGSKYETSVSWDVVLFNLVETDRPSRGACCLHHLGILMMQNSGLFQGTMPA